MFRFSTIYVYIISLIISVIIFNILQLFISNYKNLFHKSSLKANFEVVNQTQITNENNLKYQEDKKINEENTENTENWYLEIPVINLKAYIREGTEKETLDNYIGHFEETQKINGNIGLAAHNRGYKNNYFENIKNLKTNDIIIYKYENKIRNYSVKSHNVIRDTDWYPLENTQENILTLITCVENQPEYRRCIQATEVIN